MNDLPEALRKKRDELLDKPLNSDLFCRDTDGCIEAMGGGYCKGCQLPIWTDKCDVAYSVGFNACHALMKEREKEAEKRGMLKADALLDDLVETGSSTRRVSELDVIRMCRREIRNAAEEG